MLRLHVHLDGTLVLVHHDLRGVAVAYHLLEVGVGGVFADAAVLGTSAREVEQAQCHDGDDVNPVHVETGHVHLGPVSVFVGYLILVHYFNSKFISHN